MEHQALPTLQEVAATLSGDLEDDAVAKPYPTCFGGLEQPNPYHPIPNMLWSSVDVLLDRSACSHSIALQRRQKLGVEHERQLSELRRQVAARGLQLLWNRSLIGGFS